MKEQQVFARDQGVLYVKPLPNGNLEILLYEGYNSPIPGVDMSPNAVRTLRRILDEWLAEVDS